MGKSARDDDRAARRERPLSRRAFCVGACSAAALVAFGGAGAATAHAKVVRPPGGQDDDHLLSACIRCERCVQSCPRGVIVLSHLENGILNARTPQMYLKADYCDFCLDENEGVPLCASRCPTGALAPSRAGSDKPIGVASITRDWCLAYHATGCHACFDACPFEAIVLDDEARPQVVAEKCNGCGACEAACISLTAGSLELESNATDRAIVVRPLE